ncbi:hypothetical protein [Rhodoferax sp.]|uniref:hypothetical protein n=1 Tax=Rhodoferax sp. TaxID=50421 RepID=UPI00374D8982
MVQHWTQDTAEPPSWPEAYDRMVQQGRKSKVKYPSDAHLRFEVDRPVVRGSA